MQFDRQSRSACHGGSMEVWSHQSASTRTTMSFGIFLPARAAEARCPTLTCLGGLTSNHENFALKAGAQRLAAEHGLILIFPDTSPRGAGVAGEDDAIDIGTAAGFYCTATEPPWSAHYDMANYVARELPDLVEARFAADPDRRAITGFSMGGHGALVTALRNPGRYRSLSAFAPIANPTVSAWGRRAFAAYLGPDETAWQAWDASVLMARARFPGPVLVDQGAWDPYLDQLRPQTLNEAAAVSGQALELRIHPGYDHSYWFVQSFIADHLAHHARALAA